MIVVYKSDGSFECNTCTRIFMSYSFRVRQDADFHNEDEHGCTLRVIELA